jgi:hypothetical protein
MNRLFSQLAGENGLDEATVISGRIMGLIYFSDRDIFQKDVEDAFHINRSSVTSAVKLMEKKGYIYPAAGQLRRQAEEAGADGQGHGGPRGACAPCAGRRSMASSALRRTKAEQFHRPVRQNNAAAVEAGETEEGSRMIKTLSANR